MSYEKKLLTQIVDAIYNSDFCDGIVVARLGDSLDNTLDDLSRLNKKTELSEYQRIDFVDLTAYAKGLVVVLQAFTTLDFYETTELLSLYSQRFKAEEE